MVYGEWVPVPPHLLFRFSACRYCPCGSENRGSSIVSIVEIIKILQSSCRTEKLKSCVSKKSNQYHVNKGIQALGQTDTASLPIRWPRWQPGRPLGRRQVQIQAGYWPLSSGEAPGAWLAYPPSGPLPEAPRSLTL